MAKKNTSLIARRVEVNIWVLVAIAVALISVALFLYYTSSAASLIGQYSNLIEDSFVRTGQKNSAGDFVNPSN